MGNLGNILFLAAAGVSVWVLNWWLEEPEGEEERSRQELYEQVRTLYTIATITTTMTKNDRMQLNRKQMR